MDNMNGIKGNDDQQDSDIDDNIDAQDYYQDDVYNDVDPQQVKQDQNDQDGVFQFPKVDNDNGNESGGYSIKPQLMNPAGQGVVKTQTGKLKFDAPEAEKPYKFTLNYDFQEQIQGLELKEDINAQLLSVEIQVSSNLQVGDAITLAIQRLNTKLEAMKLEYTILYNGNEANWKLYISKKTGRPKVDYPSLCPETPITETNSVTFTLDPRDDSCVQNLNQQQEPVQQQQQQTKVEEDFITVRNSKGASQQSLKTIEQSDRDNNSSTKQDSDLPMNLPTNKNNQSGQKKKKKKDEDGGGCLCFGN